MNLPLLVPVQFHSNNPPTHSFATRQQLFLLATSCSFVRFFEMWAYWGLKFQILIFSSAPAFITLIFYRPQFVILRVATIIIFSIMYDTIYILSSQVRTTYMACISASFMAWQPNRHTNTHDWTWTELDTGILDWTVLYWTVCVFIREVGNRVIIIIVIVVLLYWVLCAFPRCLALSCLALPSLLAKCPSPL